MGGFCVSGRMEVGQREEGAGRAWEHVLPGTLGGGAEVGWPLKLLGTWSQESPALVTAPGVHPKPDTCNRESIINTDAPAMGRVPTARDMGASRWGGVPPAAALPAGEESLAPASRRPRARLARGPRPGSG